MNYLEFIERKIVQTPDSGFDISGLQLHVSHLPHQRDIIRWAVKGGRRAIFASFGLGKTGMQLELCRIILEQAKAYLAISGGKALIVLPLGVRQEFKKDARRLGMEVEYCPTMRSVMASKCDIIITNYERVRDGDIDPAFFTVASLDEASCLRSYGSKTYQEFLDKFQTVQYRFVCTATPSPNKYKELLHYAAFLGIMDSGQALTRWFKRDSTKANNLTLHEHKAREFWLWVASWAIFITKPSDLGYSDEGYDLPPLQVNWHRVSIKDKGLKVDRDGQIQAFREDAMDLRTASKEKRESIQERLDKAVEIMNASPIDEHFILWHHLEAERHAIEASFNYSPELASVYGSQDADTKEALLTGFAEGEYRVLATKPEIAGQGGNYQYHCHRAIFLGIDHKFNDFIQAIHRIYRFQQRFRVIIDIIYTDAEEHIRKDLEEKWARHIELIEEMTGIIKEYGLCVNAAGELKRAIGITRQVVTGKQFTAVNNDNVSEMPCIASDSVGMVLTSIPFSNHYEYTPSYLDFGHTNDDDHFFSQMDYLTPELHRVLMPGRLACIHVKDRILFGNVTGYGMPSVNPFHAKTIFHYMKHGFIFMGMITIETDVVRENNQTYRLGWSEQCKDGSKMGVGCPEYLLLFRKLPTDTSNAYADVPVTKTKDKYTRGQWQIDARAKWNSSGNSLLLPGELHRLSVQQVNDQFSAFFQEAVYDYSMHTFVARVMEDAGKLPATFETLRVPARTGYVWDDVVRMRTLNGKQTQAREQNHICPLQLDIVDRAINRWTNKGDLVLDPFGGLMTVPYRAIEFGRRGYGIELNTDYWKYGVGYCRAAEHKAKVPTLFDLT